MHAREATRRLRGHVKDGVIEVQGDHRDRLVRELEQHGWTVKRVGG